MTVHDNEMTWNYYDLSAKDSEMTAAAKYVAVNDNEMLVKDNWITVNENAILVNNTEMQKLHVRNWQLHEKYKCDELETQRAYIRWQCNWMKWQCNFVKFYWNDIECTRNLSILQWSCIDEHGKIGNAKQMAWHEHETAWNVFGK